MWQIAMILFVVSFCFFVGVMVREPRSLRSGVSFFWMMLCLAGVMFLVLAGCAAWLASRTVLIWILLILLMIALICVAVFPIALAVMFFVQGLKVIRHEGRKPANMLSVAFSVMLFGYLTVWPAMGGLGRSIFGTRLYILISLLAFYLLSLLATYALSAVLNLIHLRKRRRADYIIVLGAGLIGARVTPLLAARIDKGIELLAFNPKAMLIMSGGQGPGEDLAEGRAMADYAIDKGVDPERIVVEDRSASTEENLLFSRALMEKETPRVILVTTAYHVFRALLLARQQGMKCVGFGAKTKWYFTLNALLREFGGYLSLTWKRHAAVALVLASMAAILGI